MNRNDIIRIARGMGLFVSEDSDELYQFTLNVLLSFAEAAWNLGHADAIRESVIRARGEA